MKIIITTEREILDQDFWLWVERLKKLGIPIDAKQFKENKIFVYEEDLGHTKVKTTYRIV